ncbi:antimicrobial peptide system SdpB family protein [Dinghuibacter silviterrae]|uniref:Antimicrobial peptide system SdpB family protein n=2 Tax=Dinghuibacter silviterrae TaxID=1539049 RepID=A0A4R8DRF4_9BACT|nr:antimicrobial peptide system SdpB family protein [Dinghuibacter silviterrae]
MHKERPSPFTRVYGLSRSLLAIGTLLTLLFNPVDYIFVTSKSIHPAQLDFYKHINLFYLVGFDHLVIAKMIAVIILIIVISGYYPVVTGILHWWVSYSLFNAAVIVDGGDQITQILTFLFIPLTIMDPRPNHWTEPTKNYPYANYIGGLILTLVRIQVSILYFNAGISKFSVPEWLNGTAMYYWLGNNTFGPADYLRPFATLLTYNPIVVLLLTWGSILFEILLSASIFFSEKGKKRMLILGLMFHLFIFLFLGLGSFFFAMAGSLIIYLYPVKKPGNENGLLIRAAAV